MGRIGVCVGRRFVGAEQAGAGAHQPAREKSDEENDTINFYQNILEELIETKDNDHRIVDQIKEIKETFLDYGK
jgi:hypothetical protein